MGKLRITYDGEQLCTALSDPPGKTVATDCPYTGKGEEISPMNLLGSALAGCMFEWHCHVWTRQLTFFAIGGYVDSWVKQLARQRAHKNSIDVEPDF